MALSRIIEMVQQAQASKPPVQKLVDKNAGILPDETIVFSKALQKEGRKVAMAGDGINDSGALAQADLGLAMASGSDIAMESAGITLMKCEGCVKMVKASLDQLEGISNIETDFESKDRPLTVETDEKVREKEVVDKVQESGYTAEPKKRFIPKLSDSRSTSAPKHRGLRNCKLFTSPIW